MPNMSMVIKEIKQRVRGEVPLRKLQKLGLKVGEKFWCGDGCTFGVSHCWLISIGNNVTFSTRVHLLAHDASTQKHLGYVKIGRIVIGDNVFVGADATILPGVSIGDNSIIAAGAIVTKDVPANTVWGGVPAHVICSVDEYVSKYPTDGTIRLYDKSYTIGGGITDEKKLEMLCELDGGKIGLIR